MMETRPEVRSRPVNLGGVAMTFRVVGWLSLLLQLIFAIGMGVSLAFASSGRLFNFNTGAVNTSGNPTPGIGIGIFWAVCGLVVLLIELLITFRYTRIGSHLGKPNLDLHPRKANVVQTVRLGVIVALIGLLLTILGAGASLGVILSKTISQGTVLFDPERVVRPLDMFVAVSNMNGITAHFVGIFFSLLLLDRIRNRT